ncbi:MAG: Prolyl-tRNA synthetase [Candidatus Collierbacteria bacterium GW2011_GWF2_44_15]|nr:MAG: Prolyl-tRNA synthetase [Candidatus Collierbacteria bacterium GW2011_GWA1_44_12]KKT37186.1 MAG: Prolyl-tRNA synthetase [Candidatus Collierbacteria bacterium GW2011_GWF1_44_12]KKT45970.1 MAG: Prolyl-tRNA synthetase [Candidatus Collierbacteria bacterium GW2011_GWF2_44_15]KKT98466.1 MAG: Prolyl-tRNA synthetase [Candidatus Collierbacteria bacterium GW2011_GWC2_45_15]
MGVKPEKQSPKDAEAVNHKLLAQAGFIKQEMAGVFTYLPLGLKVLTKIENIVRKHMDKVGTEILMPTLTPKELWEKTGRLETVDILMKTIPANEVSRLKNDSEYIVSPTHEEIMTPLSAKYNLSYKDFPVSFYQIQTKFRNEPRAKNGLLRCREFRMKDLYSFHTSSEDFGNFYERMKEIYMNVFAELGLGNDTVIALASGGDFTKDYTHEFQTRLESGEDEIFLNKETGVAYNKEVAPEDVQDENKYERFNASEVGNIFPLGTKFSTAFEYDFVDADGSRKPVIMGSYGIGTSRLMGVLVEKFHDDKGIIWPENLAPFKVHLIDLRQPEKASEIYDSLVSSGVEVLLDDRETTPGEKFADADLIGCPFRVVVSEKSLAAGGVEVKRRNEKESRIVAIEELQSALG